MTLPIWAIGALPHWRRWEGGREGLLRRIETAEKEREGHLAANKRGEERAVVVEFQRAGKKEEKSREIVIARAARGAPANETASNSKWRN